MTPIPCPFTATSGSWPRSMERHLPALLRIRWSSLTTVVRLSISLPISLAFPCFTATSNSTWITVSKHYFATPEAYLPALRAPWRTVAVIAQRRYATWATLLVSGVHFSLVAALAVCCTDLSGGRYTCAPTLGKTERGATGVNLLP